MGSEWTIGHLGEVAKVLSGYAFKSGDMGTSGFPVIKIKNINPPDVNVSDVERVPPSIVEGNPRIEKFRLGKKDILIAMTGATVGKVGRMPATTESHYLNQRVGKVFVTDATKADTDFIYYVLSQNGHVDQMFDLADGSAQANISGKQIESLEIPLPPLPEQKVIAHILGSLDDKIELNRKMNATLEAMAQALFKSWFVDFDPVIDNALRAGNPIPEELADRAEIRRQAIKDGTAHEKAAKNFPAAFQETDELGWIPEGWEIGQMSDHANIEMGQSPKGDTYNVSGEGMPLVNGPVEFGPYFTKKSKWTTSPTKRSCKGDLIVCVRGSTTGRFVKSDGEYCLGRGVCSVRGKRSQCFVDQIFKSSITKMLGLTTGSTFPNWSRQTLSGFEAISPPTMIVDQFDALISPKVERIESGVLESESLTKLRDILLPKLISGEIRISGAEKLIEEVLV